MSNPIPPGAQPQATPRCYRHADRETWIGCQRCGKPICPDCMRPAAVGFHCPDCVAEAARTQRQPRTAAGGLIPQTAGRVTMVLIGINLVFFLIARFAGSQDFFAQTVMLTDCQRPSCLGYEGVDQGAWWRLLTSVFLHTQILHILFNMYALWVFGPMLERYLGYVRFLALYVSCGFAGSVAVLWLSDPARPTLGASGAIFGLFGAALVLLRSRGLDTSALLVLLGLNLVITFAVPNISWQGHLGGLAAGLGLGAVFAYAPRQRRTAAQLLALGGLWVAMLALVAAHALV